MQAVKAPVGNAHPWGQEQVDKCPGFPPQRTALGGALDSSQRSQPTKPLSLTYSPFCGHFLHSIPNSLTPVSSQATSCTQVLS